LHYDFFFLSFSGYKKYPVQHFCSCYVNWFKLC